MDLILNSWDHERQQVISRYFDSKFLGHTRASDLLDNFLKSLESFNQGNILQVSMDGPSTNWKFFENLVTRREEQDPDVPQLLNLGSCGLHVVHGAFQAGEKSTEWYLDTLLRSMYYCLHDSPARREDFTDVTGSSSMPLKFCATRWIEDVPVAERAIQIWPNIVKYVEHISARPKSKVPKIQSFKTLQASIRDPLKIAKLQFFVHIAQLLLPFLKKYQTKKPLMAFMAEDLTKMLKTLMSKFVKQSVLKNASTADKLARIELEKADNLVGVKEVDVGFAVKAIVHNAEKEGKVSKLQLQAFFTECQTFLKTTTAKLLERCPLKYPIVRNLTALDPRQIANHPLSASSKFEKLLLKLMDCNRLTPSQCDVAKEQYAAFLSEVKQFHKKECSSFSTEQRLDTFYYRLIGEKEETGVLWEVVKMMMLLSHGQADIERGFSVNKAVASDNMDESTIVAFRRAYDGMQDVECEVHDIPITAKMMESCRHSRHRYDMEMEDKKKQRKATEAQEKKRDLEVELNQQKKRKEDLDKEVAHLLQKADKLSENAESSKKWNLLIEANALRTNAKSKKREIEEAEKDIQASKKKLKLEMD
jgi:hypothetical protein